MITRLGRHSWSQLLKKGVLNAVTSARRPPGSFGRPIRRSSRSDITEQFGSVLAFAIPAALSVQFRAGFAGHLLLAEVIALLLVPLAIRNRRIIMADRFVRLLWNSSLVWLGALIASDLVEGTPLEDSMKGWGEVVFFMMGLTVMRMLVARHPDRVRLAILGLGTGWALRVIFVDTRLPWRLGGMHALALLALLALTLLSARQRWLLPAIPAVLGCIGIMVGARGTAAILFATALYLVATRMFRVRSGSLLTYEQAAIGVVLAAVVGGLIVAGYGWAASSGVLGDSEAARYEQQSEGDLGVLIGGRTSLVGSVIAITDSPLIGQGSRTYDSEYTERTRAFLEDYGYDTRFLDTAASNILTHGALLAAWVSAGVLGIVVWIVVLRVVFRAIFAAHNVPENLQPLFTYVAIQVGWGVAVSPFTGLGKIALPTALIFLIAITNDAVGRLGPSRTRRAPSRGRLFG